NITKIVFTNDISSDLNVDRLVDIDFGMFVLRGNLDVNTDFQGTMTLDKDNNSTEDSIAGNLSVDAENATINNNINVSGVVNIIDVGLNSQHQNGNANSIALSDPNGGSF